MLLWSNPSCKLQYSFFMPHHIFMPTQFSAVISHCHCLLMHLQVVKKMQNRSRKWHHFWVCWLFFFFSCLVVFCCYYYCFMVCLENPSLLSAAPHCPVQEWGLGTDPMCSTAPLMLSGKHFHEKLPSFIRGPILECANTFWLSNVALY